MEGKNKMKVIEGRKEGKSEELGKKKSKKKKKARNILEN